MDIKLNADLVRQGDVTLKRLPKEAPRPAWAKKAEPLAHGRYVAEFGESSGHEHALHGKHVLGFRATDPANAALAGLDYLEIGGSGADIKHEYASGQKAEHDTITLPEGKWVRAVQVEYDPEEERRIAD